MYWRSLCHSKHFSATKLVLTHISVMQLDLKSVARLMFFFVLKQIDVFCSALHLWGVKQGRGSSPHLSLCTLSAVSMHDDECEAWDALNLLTLITSGRYFTFVGWVGGCHYFLSTYYWHVFIEIKRQRCIGKGAFLLRVPQEQKWTHHGNTFCLQIP